MAVKAPAIISLFQIRKGEVSFPVPTPEANNAAAAVLMPEKNPIAIYELLFKEGGAVATKDIHTPGRGEQVEKNAPIFVS